MFKRSINTILIAITLVMGMLYFHQKQELSLKDNTVEWLRDSVSYYNDDRGRIISETKVLQAEKEDALKAAEIIKNKYLQEVIKTKGIQSGTVISTQYDFM